MGNMDSSNAVWFGALPESWDYRRIKNLFSMRDERNFFPLEDVNLISLYSNAGVMQNSDIEHTTGNKAKNADGYKIVHEGDIIVNILLCWMGAVGYSAYNGVTSPAYDIYIPNCEANPKYYHYLFRTPLFSQQCYKVGKGIMAMRWRTYSPQFRDIVVPHPPLAVQGQIVRFLDWKVSSVNRLISNCRHEIALLDEMKRQLIDESVTKGIRNSRLIHSGDIRWDIEYPEHWRIQRIRETFSFRKGLSITKANLEESGVAVISYGQIHSKKNSGVGLNAELIRHINESYLTANQNALVEKGDFIFADTSEDVTGCGNCVYIDWDNMIFAGYHSIIAHSTGAMNNKYLAYLFQSPTWRYQIRKKVNGVKVYSITQRILKDTFILVPPVEEQDEIVRRLDKACIKIDALVRRAEAKITLLQELKTRLISDVVTGKVNVQDIAIPEYEFVGEEADADADECGEEDTGNAEFE